MSPRGQILCRFITYSYLCEVKMDSKYQTKKMHLKYLTNRKPIKETLLHAGESTTAPGFLRQYPHPFLTPSLYSPHPLFIERWGYSKRGVRDRDIFLIGFHRKTS